MYKWSDNYSVKVSSIDKEHQKLFDITNDFYDHLMTKKPQILILETLKELSFYTKTHFRNEELLMSKHGYPKYLEHKKIHDDILVKVDELYRKMKDGKTVLAHEIGGLLKEWIFDHILKIDKQYSSFFEGKTIL
ncbi:hemerythrin family protein [bacterium]|nr:hemerythrin family protein [bacterium]